MSPETPLTFADLFKWLLSALGGLAMFVLSMFSGRLRKVEAAHELLQQQIRAVDVDKVSRDTHHEHEKIVRDMLKDM